MKREPRALAALCLIFAALTAIAIVAIPSHALTISPEETTVRTAYARASYAVELGTVNQAVLSNNTAGKTLTLAELQANLQANGLQFQLSNFKVLTMQEFGGKEAGALVLESAYVGQPSIKIGDWSAAASEGPTHNVFETEALAKWGVAPGSYTSNPSPYTLGEALRDKQYAWVQKIATYTVTATLGATSKTYDAFALFGEIISGQQQTKIVDPVTPGVDSFTPKQSANAYTYYPILLLTSITYDSAAGREYLQSSELPDFMCETTEHCFDENSFRFGPSASDVNRRLSTPLKSSGSTTPQAITVRSNLVLIPVLVKSKAGGIVFSLTAQDFAVTDNGALQSAQMEKRSEAQPLAVALVVQTGGAAASRLRDYDGLDAILDALIGGVPHQIAVVAFDSTPHLAQDFTTHTEAASDSISGLQPGDQKAAILDGIRYGIELLSKQPAEYRRTLVLLSETVDGGSRAGFEDVVRGLNDTNIAVYSFGFSSTKAAVSHEATKTKRPGGSPYHGDAYAAGGCMSRDPDADLDAGGSRSHQAFDCATDLLPPLRFGRMAFAAATDSLKRNVPESVARMTGGEYFAFNNTKTLRQGIVGISNDLPNYYILSFHPQSPTPGPHMLQVRLKNRPGLQLQARTIYWVAPA